MQRVIEIRNMHTAIHELYIIKNGVPTQKVLEIFESLDQIDAEGLPIDILFAQIDQLTDYYGEINFRDKKSNNLRTVKGSKGKKYLVATNDYYNLNNKKYKVMNPITFDLWV